MSGWLSAKHLGAFMGRHHANAQFLAFAVRCLSPAICAVTITAFVAGPVRAQSSDAVTSDTTVSQELTPAQVEASKTRPAPEQRPRVGIGRFTAFDRAYDEYLKFKQTLSDQYHLDYSLDFSFYPQVGVPSGGKWVWLGVYYPSVTWRPFTNTEYGSGKFDVTFGQQAWFSNTNTGTQASRLGLITFPNDWVSDNFTWSTISYTHTFPGPMSWFSVTAGQYNLFTFDPNEYAGNAQETFIGYPFAQDATQTFPNAGLGGYLTAEPGKDFHISSGVQGGTNLSGRAISARGFDDGKLVPWANLQWTPTFPGHGIGIYSLLIYDQPSIEGLTTHSTGISLSVSQELSQEWAGFLRVNTANGGDTPIRSSIAVGGIRNDPFQANPNDQVGLAIAWDKTNPLSVGEFPGGVRDGEWVTELYYLYTVFIGMHLTPDVQVFWNPALDRNRGPSAVFTLRSTLSF